MTFRLKFDRALQDLDALEASMDDWVQRGGHSFTQDVDPETGQQVVYIRYGSVAPVDEWSLDIGDCVQNLRNSLDHLVFELAEAFTGIPLPDSIAHKSAFPIFGKGAPTTSQLQDKIGGISPGARAIVEALQPYKVGANYERDPLWILDRLANVDKHRAIHPALFSKLGIGIAGNNFALAETFYQSGELKDGAEIVRFKASPSDPQKEMDMQLTFPLFVAFPEGPPGFREPIVPMLRNIGRYVEDIVFKSLASYR